MRATSAIRTSWRGWRQIAPVTAVRGNNDCGAWAEGLAVAEWLKVGSVLLHVVHDLAELSADTRAAGLRAVISGHSHQPRVEERDGMLFVNPGSAGPRRFKLPISAGELLVTGDAVVARTVELGVATVLTLLVRPVSGLEGVLRRIAELADGQASPLAELDVKLNSSQSIIV
jgi:uncharacterized protein